MTANRRHEKNTSAMSVDASATPTKYEKLVACKSIARRESAKAGGMRALKADCGESTQSESTMMPSGIMPRYA